MLSKHYDFYCSRNTSDAEDGLKRGSTVVGIREIESKVMVLLITK